MILNPQLRIDMNLVVDCFTKMDGGIHYVKLCKHINKLERMARTDPEAAKELAIIRTFSRIVVNVQ